MVSMEYIDNLISAYSSSPQPFHRLNYVEDSKHWMLKRKRNSPKYEHKPKRKGGNGTSF